MAGTFSVHGTDTGCAGGMIKSDNNKPNPGKGSVPSAVWSKAGSHTVLCLERDQVHHSWDGLPCTLVRLIFTSSACLCPKQWTGGLEDVSEMQYI